ncbi:NTP transferase domain-containing protein [Haliscomenobacter sp.]|uniref:nucleotidyltransferase family protein n=1 Tax=Haliscomenobacter sp. TaxID=2717303 RepID=UPI0035948579
MENAEPQTGIIILAAGASTRMGQAKQLLRIGGESLIQKAVKTALGTIFRPVLVVLGANREQIEPELQSTEILKVFNPDWSTGMGSSIATGLAHLLQQTPSIQQVLILVGDQPLLKVATLTALVELQSQTQAPLVVSRYTNTLGVPALFTQALFGDLAALHSAQGAKALIQQHLHQAAVLDFPEGALDLDTPEEWAAFLTKINFPG